MCDICGCGTDEVNIEGGHHHHHHHDDHGHSHEHDHQHEHSHPHSHEHGHAPAAVQPIVINHYYQAGSQVNQYFSPAPTPAANHTHSHDHNHGHDHSHDHSHSHSHDHNGSENGGRDLDFGANPAGVTVSGIAQERLITLEKNILEKNNSLANTNRTTFNSKRVFAVNLISSPGAGKTTLVAKTVEELRNRGRTSAAIIGDQQTARDADRIRETGVDALQINTGKGCHLDAHMVGHAAENLGLQEDSTLFIENVGNLVCPAGFDLGEHRRVVMISVTEGEDKPLKYPAAIAGSHLLLIHKVDLLGHVDFDIEACERYARVSNPEIRIIRLSTKTGEGFEEWMSWLETETGMAIGQTSEVRASL